MPVVVTRLPRRVQTATWFAQTGHDAFGQPSFAAGVEIACRWEDVSEEFMDTDGSKQMSSSVIFPDRELSIGDKLQLSTLIGSDVALALEVKQFDKIPDVRARRYLLVAYTKRGSE